MPTISMFYGISAGSRLMTYRVASFKNLTEMCFVASSKNLTQIA